MVLQDSYEIYGMERFIEIWEEIKREVLPNVLFLLMFRTHAFFCAVSNGCFGVFLEDIQANHALFLRSHIQTEPSSSQSKNKKQGLIPSFTN